jgi:hypothetical protein
MRKSLALAALLAATLVTSPVVHASPSVTSPGAHLVSTIMSGNGTPYLCTLGFIVRGIRGSQGALTAGHCNRDPESGTVLQRTPNGDVMVGVYVRQEISPGFRDVGFVEFVPEVADVVTDIGGWHVSRVLTAKEIHTGMELCKSGARTDLSCGPVVFVDANEVRFRAWDDLGDSGSPVYTYLPDGTLGAVGTLYGHSDDAAGRIINVTLADPVMRAWGLSLG